MSNSQFNSCSTFPTSSIKDLSLIAAFHLSQREGVIAEQRAKRRGGSKKCKLTFAITNPSETSDRDTSNKMELIWKTICEKNFSNKNHISQYQRNPFAMQTIVTGNDRFVVVIHGAVKSDGVVSNSTGVNMSGKELAAHPRFLLSSGKGELGAKSTIMIYASNKQLGIQIDRVWLEHPELKVSIEEITALNHVQSPSIRSMSDVPYVQFNKKFKIVYETKNRVDGEATTEIGVSTAASKTAATASSSADSSTPSLKRKKSSKRSSWMSAEEMAAHMKQSNQPAAAALAIAQPVIQTRMTDDASIDQDDHDDHDEEAERAKQAKFFEAQDQLESAVAQFSGYDIGFDQFQANHNPMDDAPFNFNESIADGVDDAMMDDGDSTPTSQSSDASTPIRSLTPSPSSNVESSSHQMDIFSQMTEAEDRHDEFNENRVFRQKAASQQMTSMMLPEALRVQQMASGFTVSFQQFQPSPLAQPMVMDFNSRSPSFLPPLELSYSTSPPPELFSFDCKKRQSNSPSAAAVSYAQF